MARNYGGNTKFVGEAQKRTDEMRTKYGNKKGFATGGRVHMTAGAGTGEGREQKIKAYGKKAK